MKESAVVSQADSSFSVALYPLVKRQRLVIREHAEAVYHLTRDTALVPASHDSCSVSGFGNESVDECLVVGVMHMTEEHEGRRVAVLVERVLSVVAEYGIVHEYDLSLLVLHLLVVLHPFKAGDVEGTVLEIPVVVVSLDKVQSPVEAGKVGIRLLPLSEGEIPKDYDVVVLPHLFVPFLNHRLVHLLDRGEGTHVHAGQ